MKKVIRFFATRQFSFLDIGVISAFAALLDAGYIFSAFAAILIGSAVSLVAEGVTR